MPVIQLANTFEKPLSAFMASRHFCQVFKKGTRCAGRQTRMLSATRFINNVKGVNTTKVKYRSRRPGKPTRAVVQGKPGNPRVWPRKLAEPDKLILRHGEDESGKSWPGATTPQGEATLWQRDGQTGAYRGESGVWSELVGRNRNQRSRPASNTHWLDLIPPPQGLGP